MSIRNPTIRQIDFNRYTPRDGVAIQYGPGIYRTSKGVITLLPEKSEVIEDA